MLLVFGYGYDNQEVPKGVPVRNKFASQWSTRPRNIDGKEHTLKPNEGIEIKVGQKHFITNKNNTDLEFILYSTPSTKNDRIDL